MSSRPELKLDWCTHEAAKYAVEHWHYSKRCPVGKASLIGVWEEGRFIGVVWFGRGANKDMATSYKVTATECCELVRIALCDHKSPVSRIVRIALMFLKRHCPGIRVCVSYADESQGHHGGVYQAGNWLYAGRSQPSIEWWHEGRWKHNREMTGGPFGKKRNLVTPGMLKRKQPGKHKYLMPLDEAMKKQIEPLRKPYPKRVRSVDSDTSAIHAEMGGANPTRTLSISED
jgi:hypothetical protein